MLLLFVLRFSDNDALDDSIVNFHESLFEHFSGISKDVSVKSDKNKSNSFETKLYHLNFHMYSSADV